MIHDSTVTKQIWPRVRCSTALLLLKQKLVTFFSRLGSLLSALVFQSRKAVSFWKKAPIFAHLVHFRSPGAQELAYFIWKNLKDVLWMKTLNELPLLMDQNRAMLKKKGQNIHKSVDFQYQELHIFPPITPHLLMYT